MHNWNTAAAFCKGFPAHRLHSEPRSLQRKLGQPNAARWPFAVMGLSFVTRLLNGREALTLLTALLAPAAMARQPVQLLPKVGGCQLGHYSPGNYFVSSSSTSRETIKR